MFRGVTRGAGATLPFLLSDGITGAEEGSTGELGAHGGTQGAPSRGKGARGYARE